MAFLDFLFGKNEKLQEFPRYTKQQQDILNQLAGGAQQQLPDVFNYLQGILGQSPEAMQQFQAPALRQFKEEIIPSIAERFTKVGAQGSSAFTQALGKAGAGLAENLASQRATLSSNAINQLLQLLSGGLTQQSEQVFRPRSSGFLEDLLSYSAPGVGQNIANLFRR